MTQAISPSNDVICYLRRTKQWAESYSFADDKYSSNWKAVIIARKWGQIFTESYRYFRCQLHELQLENLREIGLGYCNQFDYAKTDRIVVPSDDDDWFHPDIVPVLRKADHPVVYWNFLNYSIDAVQAHDSSKEPLRFETNNYAVKEEVDEKCLVYHVYANDKLKSNTNKHIDRHLSIHNRSLASLSVLQPLLEDNFETKVIELYDRCQQPVDLTGVPDYFHKFFDRMSDLYRNKLKIRKWFA
jgi:hypothetical protein